MPSLTCTACGVNFRAGNFRGRNPRCAACRGSGAGAVPARSSSGIKAGSSKTGSRQRRVASKMNVPASSSSSAAKAATGLRSISRQAMVLAFASSGSSLRQREASLAGLLPPEIHTLILKHLPVTDWPSRVHRSVLGWPVGGVLRIKVVGGGNARVGIAAEGYDVERDGETANSTAWGRLSNRYLTGICHPLTGVFLIN